MFTDFVVDHWYTSMYLPNTVFGHYDYTEVDFWQKMDDIRTRYIIFLLK